MPDQPDTTRRGAHPPIPTVDQIRWANSPRPKTRLEPDPPELFDSLRPRESKRRTIGVTAALVLSGIIGGALALDGRADAARLADPSCWTHEVTRGDTLTSIARNHGVPLDVIKQLNPQLAEPSWNLIHPGDHVAYACPENAMAPARPEHVDVERFRNIWESDGVLSWESIIAEFYLAGFRGDDLVTMAAITPAESGRRPGAVGDLHLANATWDGSFGIAQVRALRAQEGTGGPRDAAALKGSVEHQAYGAYEVWRSQGFRAWTVFQKSWHLGHLAHARAVAQSMGVVA
jgi:hypothetical protein